MPLLQFDMIEGRTPEACRKVLDTTHRVVVDVFGVPERDRYQIVHENKSYHMVCEDTGLGFQRSDNFILLRVYTSPRTDEQRQRFMATLAQALNTECGIDGQDLMISFITNQREDWSFGNGEAQYVTGAL